MISIKRIATAINESLHQKEAQQKVLKIQQQFQKDSRYMDLVTPTRYPVKEGLLQKKFSKLSRQLSGYREYYFFLFNDILLYAARSGIAKTSYQMKHFVPLLDIKHVKLLPGSKKQNKHFEISSDKGKNLILQADSQEERDSWCEALTKQIQILRLETKSLKIQNFDGKVLKRSAKIAALTGTHTE